MKHKGERISRVEALIVDQQPQLDRRFGESEKLFSERLNGLRTELNAINTAQKEAVDKAEKSATQRFETFVEQNDRKAEVTQNRLAALEAITSEARSADRTAAQLKSSTVAWISAAAAVAIVFVTLIAYHVI